MEQIHPEVQELHQRFHNMANEVNAVVYDIRELTNAQFTLTLNGPEAATVLNALGQSTSHMIALLDAGLSIGAERDQLNDGFTYVGEGLDVAAELLAAYIGSSVPDELPAWLT